MQLPLRSLADRLPLRVMVWLGVVIFFFLFLRLVSLQIISGGYYRDVADSNRVSTTVIKAMRGLLLDRSGTPLVKNTAVFSLQVDAGALGARNSSALIQPAEHISIILGVPTSQILDALQQSLTTGQPVTAINKLTYKQALSWQTGVRGLTGVRVTTTYSRQYVSGSALGPVLGYTSTLTKEDVDAGSADGYAFDDRIGRTGIEAFYETLLRGRDGVEQYEVNGHGEPQILLKNSDQTPGHNLQLTIDSELQNTLYNQLANAVDAAGLPGGAAVALDPTTGEVLALVSYPAVDSNDFTKGISQVDYNKLLKDARKPLFARATSGTFPSGSTFKPIVAAGALEAGVIDKNFTVNSVGGLDVNGQRFDDWKSGGHGITNVTKGLAESVNTFFYIIGGGNNSSFEGLGADRIRQYAVDFGLTAPTGIDLPGEAAGFLPSPGWKEEVKNEPWFLGDTYNFAIGQGDVLVTPLQVANYTAAFANGGTLYRPHLLRKVFTQDGSVMQTVQPTIHTKQVVSKKSINIVREGMRQAVTAGSAQGLLGLPVEAAAKTGTAQFGDEGKTHAWITTFAPYDKPQIVITVLLEAGGEGSEAALPVARAGLEEYFSQK